MYLTFTDIVVTITDRSIDRSTKCIDTWILSSKVDGRGRERERSSRPSYRSAGPDHPAASAVGLTTQTSRCMQRTASCATSFSSTTICMKLSAQVFSASHLRLNLTKSYCSRTPPTICIKAQVFPQVNTRITTSQNYLNLPYFSNYHT